jgi:hypothetical protein
MIEHYLHSPICLHGIVIIKLRTGPTLSFTLQSILVLQISLTAQNSESDFKSMKMHKRVKVSKANPVTGREDP